MNELIKKLRIFGMKVLKENSEFMKENAQISIDYNEAKLILSQLTKTCEHKKTNGFYSSACGYHGISRHVANENYCSECGGKIEIKEVKNED